MYYKHSKTIRKRKAKYRWEHIQLTNLIIKSGKENMVFAAECAPEQVRTLLKEDVLRGVIDWQFDKQLKKELRI